MNKIKKYVTEQELFWAGDFGSDYIQRRKTEEFLASNLSFFSQCLKKTSDIKTCIEFGSNIGINLNAIKLILPHIKQYAIEINSKAVEVLKTQIPNENIINCSISEFNPTRKWDLVLIKGVLIHINPEYLDSIYEKLVTSSSKYLLIAEYYNPTPIMVNYRGFDNKLFKRDFAGEMLDKFSNLKLIDYGFVYHRDNNFKQDDITWFLLKVK